MSPNGSGYPKIQKNSFGTPHEIHKRNHSSGVICSFPVTFKCFIQRQCASKVCSNQFNRALIMGKKGGGGKVSVPKVDVPQGVNNLGYNTFPSLGYYAGSTLPSILGMANWASDIATGGNAMQGGSYLGAGNSDAYNDWNQYTGGAGLQNATSYPGFSTNSVASAPGQGGSPGVQSAGAPGIGPSSGNTWDGTLTQSQAAQLRDQGFDKVMDNGRFIPLSAAINGSVKLSPNAMAFTQSGQNNQSIYGPNIAKYFGLNTDTGQTALGGGPAATGIGGQRLGLTPFTGGTALGGGPAATGIGGQRLGIAGGGVSGSGGVSGGGQNDQATNQLLGPFLSQAWNTIGQELSATNIIPGLMRQTGRLSSQALADSSRFMGQGDKLMSSGQSLLDRGLGLVDTGQGLVGSGQGLVRSGQNVFGQGENMLTDSTTGAGLYPSQKAMIDQAVARQKTNLASQLASEGLGSSTMLQQMKGQADLSGAATAGQLVQGNISAAQAQEQLGLGQQQIGIGQEQTGISQQGVGIQQQGVGLGQEGVAQQQYNLGQASQKIALAGQELSLGEQAALTQELASIASQSAGLQGQMWNQAMQGYGMFGNMMQTALSAFGYSLQAFNIQTGASAANASNALQAQLGAAQANNQGMSSMLGGLGQIMGMMGGGSGGGGGGLLGSLGSLFGGIGGTAGAAAGAGTAAVGTGVGIAAGGTAAGAGASAAATAVGLAFTCHLAMEIYGVNNPKWRQFRLWLLCYAPKGLRKLYARHSRCVAVWVREHEGFKPLFRFMMDYALETI
jgi:hypothetical protein